VGFWLAFCFHFWFVIKWLFLGTKFHLFWCIILLKIFFSYPTSLIISHIRKCQNKCQEYVKCQNPSIFEHATAFESCGTHNLLFPLQIYYRLFTCTVKNCTSLASGKVWRANLFFSMGNQQYNLHEPYRPITVQSLEVL
jgi:hypothetical protein